MAVLSLFNTCGHIFGPAIMVAGVLAIALCLWASRRSSSLRARRFATAFSLTPLAISICGAMFGLVLWWATAQAAVNPADAWLNIGKVCLAGLVVSSLPFLWSLLLLRWRGTP